MVGGNTVLRYKDALNDLERTSPGIKASFLFGFLEGAQAAHFPADSSDSSSVVECSRCGQPTVAPRGKAEDQPAVCAFCRTRSRLLRVVEKVGA